MTTGPGFFAVCVALIACGLVWRIAQLALFVLNGFRRS